jgi:BRCT domain type II-containing protein
MVLTGQRFVLSGTWPRLGGGQGLALGKDNVKATIERQGGTVTSGFLCLTNALVVGDNPGQKKVIDAHECSLPIVKLKQLISIITNSNKTILDPHSVPYPETVFTILTQNIIQVKCPPPILDLTEQR